MDIDGEATLRFRKNVAKMQTVLSWLAPNQISIGPTRRRPHPRVHLAAGLLLPKPRGQRAKDARSFPSFRKVAPMFSGSRAPD